MSAKQDIELRISANDLGTKKLEEIAQVLAQLRQAQDAYAASGDAASKSLRELTQEMADLKKLGQELSGRGALLDLFEKQQQAAAEAAKRVDESRAALERYKASLTGVETVTKKQQGELGKLEKGFGSATKRFESASKALEKIRGDLSKLGLADTAKARNELVSLANNVGAALTRSEQSVRRYDAALREKREAERLAAESAKRLAEAQRQAAQASRENDTRRQFLSLARGALEVVSAARAAQTAASTLAPAGDTVARSLQAIADPAREATRQIGTLEKALSALEADLKAASSGDANAAANIRRQRTEYAAFARDATKAAIAIAGTIDAYKRQSAVLNQTGAALTAARERLNAYAAQVIKAVIPTEELRRKLAAAKAEIAGTMHSTGLAAQYAKESAAVAALSARLAEAGIDASNLAGAETRLQGVTTRLAAAQATLGAGTVRLGQANKKAAASFLDVADKGRKALTIYQRIRGQVLAMTSAYVGLFGVLRFAQTSIQAVVDREATMIRLQVANGGDQRRAAQDFAFVRQEAERLGLALQPLAMQYSRFAIAADSANLSSEQTKQTFLGFVEAARVFNLSVEDTQGVFRALEQVMSKGKVQAEELRGQLGDRLSGAFTVFARALGLSNRELDKMLETGSIGSKEIVKLASEYRKLVAGQLEPATKSLQAQFGRLDNALTEFKLSVANGGLTEVVRDLTIEFTAFLRSAEGAQTARDIAEGFRALGNVLLAVIKHFKVLKETVITLFGYLGARFILNQVAAFSKFAVAIRATAAALGGATFAARAASIALRAIPVVALAAGIAALIRLYLTWRTRTTEVQKAGEELRKAIVELNEAQDDQRENATERVRLLRAERAEMLKAAQAAYARALAERELTSALNRRSPRGEPGEGAFRAGRTNEQEGRIRELRAQIDMLTAQIAEADKAIKSAQDYRPAPETETEEAAVVDTKALEALQKERVRLEQEAVDAIMEARKEALSAEKDNIEAELALIDFEFGERVLRIRELQEQLRAVGSNDTAVALDPLIDTFLKLRDIERSEVQRNAVLRERKSLQAELEAREQAITDAIAKRDARIDLVNTKRELGLITQRQAEEESLRIQLDAQQQILDRVQALRDFIANNEANLAEFLNIDEVLLGLDKIELETKTVQSAVTKMVAEMQEGIAGGLTDSLVAFGAGIADVLRGVGSLGDAFKSAKDAFLNFAADFLLNIAKMIIQAQILKALQAIPGLGGVLGSIAGMTAHTGAVVGHGGGTPRAIPAWMVATAPRYHNGTMVGLRPDERPAILQTGEEVLSRRDARNALNGGGAQGPQTIKIINTLDRDSLAREVLSTPTAIKTIANVIQANKASFKQALA